MTDTATRQPLDIAAIRARAGVCHENVARRNVRALCDEVDALRAIASADFRALLAVEWIETWNLTHHQYFPTCPACGNYPSKGHTSDCLVNAALKSAKGE